MRKTEVDIINEEVNNFFGKRKEREKEMRVKKHTAKSPSQLLAETVEELRQRFPWIVVELDDNRVNITPKPSPNPIAQVLSKQGVFQVETKSGQTTIKANHVAAVKSTETEYTVIELSDTRNAVFSTDPYCEVRDAWLAALNYGEFKK